MLTTTQTKLNPIITFSHKINGSSVETYNKLFYSFFFFYYQLSLSLLLLLYSFLLLFYQLLLFNSPWFMLMMNDYISLSTSTLLHLFLYTKLYSWWVVALGLLSTLSLLFSISISLQTNKTNKYQKLLVISQLNFVDFISLITQPFFLSKFTTHPNQHFRVIPFFIFRLFWNEWRWDWMWICNNVNDRWWLETTN